MHCLITTITRVESTGCKQFHASFLGRCVSFPVEENQKPSAALHTQKGSKDSLNRVITFSVLLGSFLRKSERKREYGMPIGDA
ncbi:hypothetical protein CEXT_3111 [Caerostris extrusa]|uniref:Uncharacterized protein n=1 Tax=Caerostris extrusa TaxID=172846 RepID=A0AAV4WHI8_CAEEX|nr:hypothetical protein CEXT_3111 [Caerostris extrusa]